MSGQPPLARDGAVIPRHGVDTLAELMPSVARRLGVPGFEQAPLALPEGDRFVVLLVDGLGREQLREHLDLAPHLAGLFEGSGRLTAAVPSTTATSLTCLGTGIAPGQHGMAGYAFRSPHSSRLMNALTWDGGPRDPLAFQPHRTVFEACARDLVAVSAVAPVRFEGSGLTRAALRGPDFVGIQDERDHAGRIRAAVDASRRGRRSLVYVYERELDHTGHGRGVASADWRSVLRRVDESTRQLREQLDPEVCLVVTGDHGMVDIPATRHVLLEDHPELSRDLDLFGGEGRLRQLYTRRPDELASRWRAVLGDRAWVLRRDEAVEEGWFGAMDDSLLRRFGDVLVALRDDWAVMSRSLPRELSLVGQHGSLTEAEMAVPLLVDAGAGPDGGN